MINYHLECKTPTSQFIKITLEISVQASGTVKLQLPAWRAGRYQFANYVQNIRSFHIVDADNHEVKFEKSSQDAWVFEGIAENSYTVNYEYYCAKMDAGSCWVDDEQIYLNFVNCCFEVVGRSEEKISIDVTLPSDFLKCTTLPIENNQLFAYNFQQLADSSFLASKSLTHESFKVNEVAFHLWFHGQIHFDLISFKEDIKGFIKKQIEAFGEFPVTEYHFIYQLLPYDHYHGVEHQRGTVITFGPAESLSKREHMNELMGVSCHELYHAWNVCQIRPTEIMPYDFSKEAYHKAGWIVEGVTTYMGDIFLLISGYFSMQEYSHTFEKMLNREALTFGWQNQSIVESSFDLWIDGYSAGIPDKKVSIYTHGALIAFCLDMMLLEEKSSLHQVMKILWNCFGKVQVGYTMDEIWEVVLSQTESPELFNKFHQNFIAGNEDIFPIAENLFHSIGFELGFQAKENDLASSYGIIMLEDGKISKVHPTSEAYEKLMIGDLIQAQVSVANDIKLSIDRWGRKLEIELKKSNVLLFKDYFLIDKKNNLKRDVWMRV